MVNPDHLEGIAGDRKCMDHLYTYFKYKKDIANGVVNSQEEREYSEYASCLHYIIAISQGILTINNLSNGSKKQGPYLDWLRWNRDIIIKQLKEFEKIQFLLNLVNQIGVCITSIKVLYDSYFQLTEDEKGICNQYAHAYRRVLRYENQPKTVYIHTGELFLNYVNYLRKRYYIHKLDRNGVTFSQLDMEAEYLITKLRYIDPDLAKRIKLANEAYSEFRNLDGPSQYNQDRLIEYALQLAHKRASESRFQSIIRNTKEAYERVMRNLRKKLDKTLKATAILFDPLLNPKKSIESLIHFGKHPLDSLSEICSWAYENKKKFALIVLGGIVIGACCAAPPAAMIGGAIAAMTSTSFGVGIGAAGVAFGAVYGITIPIAIAGSNVIQIKTKSAQEIMNVDAQAAASKAQIEAEGHLIAAQVIYEKCLRERLRQEREEDEEMERQITAMSEEELQSAHPQLNNAIPELMNKLLFVQTEMAQIEKDARELQGNSFILREGIAAASRITEQMSRRAVPATPWIFHNDFTTGVSNSQTDINDEIVLAYNAQTTD